MAQAHGRRRQPRLGRHRAHPVLSDYRLARQLVHFGLGVLCVDADRKHGLYWSRSRPPRGINQMDQIWRVAALLLRGVFLLQPVPPLLLPEATVGAVRVLRRAGPLDVERGRHHHGDGPTRRQGGDWLARPRAHRHGGLSELRAGRHEPRPQVQCPDERGADEHLLRFILRRRAVFVQECRAQQEGRRAVLLARRRVPRREDLAYLVRRGGIAVDCVGPQGDCRGCLVHLAGGCGVRGGAMTMLSAGSSKSHCQYCLAKQGVRVCNAMLRLRFGCCDSLPSGC